MGEIKEKVFLHWDLINRIAVKRFGNSALAEEAALAVIDGLQVDNWQRVRKFRGKASFTTFIGALAVRLLEDFARRKFGRTRPPVWLQRMGEMWQKLYRTLCLERLGTTEAIETVFQSETEAEKERIEDAAYEILARIPQCGSHQGLEISYNDNSANGNISPLSTDRGHGPYDQGGGGNVSGTGSGVKGNEAVLEKMQTEILIDVVYRIVLGAELPQKHDVALEKFQQLQICLNSEERLLLKLCYRDHLPVSKAAKMLGLSRHQVNGKLRRLMLRLRTEFERVGLGEEMRLVLGRD